EVCLASRARMTELWEQRGRDPLRGHRLLRIGLNPPRESLYERINARARAMFSNGLVEETRSLLEHFGAIAALQSLGYHQAAQLLRGELNLEQAIAAAQQGHRNFAKRQMTWFRREPEVIWLEGFGDDAATAQQAAEYVLKGSSGSGLVRHD
ncbi:MAG TPA: tRNA dimethylallyltransferase, partial [Terracidiphilus sp.]